MVITKNHRNVHQRIVVHNGYIELYKIKRC